jgi:fructose-1,6-bisphosphatase
MYEYPRENQVRNFLPCGTLMKIWKTQNIIINTLNKPLLQNGLMKWYLGFILYGPLTTYLFKEERTNNKSGLKYGKANFNIEI